MSSFFGPMISGKRSFKAATTRAASSTDKVVCVT
jgi:hypothetical protein